jgi:hypothetical protein
MKQLDKGQITGWVAVGIATVITCFWAFWGIVENFHEGWYYHALLANIGLMLAQYLSPMLIFMGVTLVSLFWPRFGAVLYLILALLAAWFFQALTNAAVLLIIIPLAGIGLLYWFGRPRPRRLAVSLVVGLPLLTLVIAGAAPALRVSQRLDDRDLQARLVAGNGTNLIWAPAGPGWPREGLNWHKAQEACRHLTADGRTLTPTAKNIWRLPSVEEAVRSMSRQGQNSGGTWDAEHAAVTYQTTPDKEAPLWDIYSQVIYWWTATEVDADHAYIIVYDGRVWPRAKQLSQAYLGFRCVKQPAP